MARICGVSVQTLRYYDKIGILCADRVDKSTGYRYYSEEKIKDFDTVQKLKDLNFSLEEIKEFMSYPPYRKLLMYGKKKEELLADLAVNNEKIHRIDEICSSIGEGVIPLNGGSLDVPFEDDPESLGKWEYCGDLPEGTEFCGEECLEKRERIHLDRLFFLPGGQDVWTYFWTKGILYIDVSDVNCVIPNKYTLFSYNGERYMRLQYDYMHVIEPSVPATVRIYKRVMGGALTLRDAYPYRDDVNLLYVPDSRVIGEWEAIDVINTPGDFSTVPCEDKKPYFIHGIEFFERGICYKFMHSGPKSVKILYSYTKDYVLCERQSHAERYEIRTVADRDYMIMEHKSGDYSYLGEINCYYVFRRVSK